MILQVENASFSYKKGVPVIRDLNMQAESGELVAILGPNGAGKTTLLRCIMGFLRWDSGQSLLDGKNIRSLSHRQLWQRVAYVPQAKGAFSSLPVRDMILLGRTSRVGVFSTPSRADLDQVEAVADGLGIHALLDKRCTEISGGELQMVLIARALAAQPELLILDEPESNLDFKNQLIVLEAMSKLAADGMCCIFNTHYPTHALTRAHKALILHKRGGSSFGETQAVVTEAAIRRAFGVETVIGEIETPGKVYRSILPLHIAEGETPADPADPERPVIAVLSILCTDPSRSRRINQLLHERRERVIGRMGMPYPEAGLAIINVTLDGPLREIESLGHSLSVLPGVEVKTTLTEKGEKNNGPFQLD